MKKIVMFLAILRLATEVGFVYAKDLKKMGMPRAATVAEGAGAQTDKTPTTQEKVGAAVGSLQKVATENKDKIEAVKKEVFTCSSCGGEFTAKGKCPHCGGGLKLKEAPKKALSAVKKGKSAGKKKP